MNTILIVDDEPANISLISNTLSQEYKLLAATSGKKALELISKQNVNLVLLDIMMPKMDGFEVCAKIRQESKLKEIPIIFISALSSLEDRLKAFDVGATDYIAKPPMPDELLAKVKVEIQNYLESIKQKKVLDKLVDNVKSSSTIISEVEAISDYFLELLAVESEEKILFYLLKLLHKIELDAIVTIKPQGNESQGNELQDNESSDNELIQISTSKVITPLATSILEKARANNMSMQFSDKLVVHKNKFTILISNMPSQDKERCEQIANNIEKIIRGSNLSLNNLSVPN